MSVSSAAIQTCGLVISDNQWQSAAIQRQPAVTSGTQRQSAAISGNQRQSAAIQTCGNQWQPAVTSGNQRQSVAISGNPDLRRGLRVKAAPAECGGKQRDDHDGEGAEEGDLRSRRVDERN